VITTARAVRLDEPLILLICLRLSSSSSQVKQLAHQTTIAMSSAAGMDVDTVQVGTHRVDTSTIGAPAVYEQKAAGAAGQVILAMTFDGMNAMLLLPVIWSQHLAGKSVDVVVCGPNAATDGVKYFHLIRHLAGFHHVPSMKLRLFVGPSTNDALDCWLPTCEAACAVGATADLVKAADLAASVPHPPASALVAEIAARGGRGVEFYCVSDASVLLSLAMAARKNPAFVPLDRVTPVANRPYLESGMAALAADTTNELANYFGFATAEGAAVAMKAYKEGKAPYPQGLDDFLNGRGELRAKVCKTFDLANAMSLNGGKDKYVVDPRHVLARCLNGFHRLVYAGLVGAEDAMRRKQRLKVMHALHMKLQPAIEQGECKDFKQWQKKYWPEIQKQAGSSGDIDAATHARLIQFWVTLAIDQDDARIKQLVADAGFGPESDTAMQANRVVTAKDGQVSSPSGNFLLLMDMIVGPNNWSRGGGGTSVGKNFIPVNQAGVVTKFGQDWDWHQEQLFAKLSTLAITGRVVAM
jgi:hypothetical protein